jgi:hypothetical protein
LGELVIVPIKLKKGASDGKERNNKKKKNRQPKWQEARQLINDQTKVKTAWTKSSKEEQARRREEKKK